MPSHESWQGYISLWRLSYHDQPSGTWPSCTNVRSYRGVHYVVRRIITRAGDRTQDLTEWDWLTARACGLHAGTGHGLSLTHGLHYYGRDIGSWSDYCHTANRRPRGLIEESHAGTGLITYPLVHIHVGGGSLHSLYRLSSTSISVLFSACVTVASFDNTRFYSHVQTCSRTNRRVR